MIESRYKIEYVLPVEDVKQTSSFRVLWYLLLIPLVLLAVTAITYDFSLKDISRDSLVLVEKAKIHVFNLVDTQQLEKQTNTVVKKPIQPTPKARPKIVEKITKKVAITTTPTPLESSINQDKPTITELTSKKELQLKNIQKQISQNSTLTQNLSELSEQLVLEKVKNEELNVRLAAQEKDKIELEEQLNKILEDSPNKELSLEYLTLKDDEEKTLEVELKVSESEESIQTKPIKVTPKIVQTVIQEPEKEIELSETDKIIQSMTNIASDKEKAVTAELNPPVIEPEVTIELAAKIKTETVNVENKSINNKKIIIDEQAINTEEVIESKQAIPLSKPTLAIQETKPAAIIKTEIVEDTKISEIKTELTENNIKTESEDKVKTTSQTTGNNSAVDNIIAAMQESQSSSTSSNTPNEGQDIDLELEKDIEQQLVEKGDLSIEN